VPISRENLQGGGGGGGGGKLDQDAEVPKGSRLFPKLAEGRGGVNGAWPESRL